VLRAATTGGRVACHIGGAQACDTIAGNGFVGEGFCALRRVTQKSTDKAPRASYTSAAMRRSRHVLLVALLALCLPAATLGGLFGGSKAKGAAAGGDGEVLVLSGAESLDAAVKAHSFLVVEFYAPVRGLVQAPR
jgi:hypothetical protein